ncbi:fimbrial protein [Serratia proteamaculans]|jgi:type 1 fimbria pilin|uniref:fimbrial protein n=1 Tax=Serratia proteamaculans TaxID=28151 RepID=UPI0021772DC5|nr:fimbrial protein [Serratia proteamaculans]CAI0906165.1 Minor fimbrial protein prsF precursor [Serratia proteamaculans]CAI0971677.1 Minor fimbrial protein prsF precursor [Serratia proteamaculans]CAI1056646.1 Minor fimbrial protein prsF precursor [Serratia proteamaculans]CAI1933058.1 Minor fimbrial protein prsF precursor [Serratia proteamaculans]CAI2010886.1 Minor fimbrial protein prsF precursor [Serratia proteamaculans]
MQHRILLALWATGMSLSGSVQAENMRFFGTLIEPPPCVINGDKPIEVNFGNDVMTSRVDGTSYKKMPVPYTLNCTGTATNALRMQIEGTAAGFNNQWLNGNKTNFAIALLKDGAAQGVNRWFNFTYPAVPVLEAVPAKNPAGALTGGTFNATATMKIDYR